MKEFTGKALAAYDTLESGKGLGNDFLGWDHLPSEDRSQIYDSIDEICGKWRDLGVDLVVSVGIGGSYLGAQAAIEALSHSFAAQMGGKGIQVVFAGNNLSQDYICDLMDLVEKRSAAVIVISKSGTTTEPAIAFRILKQSLEAKYGKKESRNRIAVVTDAHRGALKSLSEQEGYRSFVIPDNVGGRFSVLTPVGLLPIAAAGFDYRAIMKGALEMENVCSERSEDNPAVEYAAIRNALQSIGKQVEILVNFEPRLRYFGEWWKQLFGESEGKDHKGIFPAAVNFTTDLHSMGQYIQDGQRFIFETVIAVENSCRSMKICNDPQNLDGLNFLNDKEMNECNRMARLGTKLAHVDGGVPNVCVEIPEIDEYSIGELFYFFEKSCGMSGYILGVNPFNQPGVEAYKKNMFALLGKPGYEEAASALKERL
ncbi:MAG: glucose-6-phosphate isomerase [Bacteroidales bacterium]|nr:glucose-6-phosphate isomerase [Bacteroidales bacterium]MCI2121807.1 glucose-6-phosphate isomerase [Bacteroidales bacterium]MCI2144667.1 glucose-6-phosphate isomerase [Bacteroidales bacterium]